jgi:MFS-type transporter involved in bile tolerance (Atg22 family)
MTDQLEFSSTETGLVVLLVLVGSIPGALLASRVALRWDPVRSAMAASILLILNTLTEAIVLKGPGQQMAAYFFSIVWGIGTGWKWTNDRMLASVLIPNGQDAELMGTYLFASQCLTWVPPLVFTLMNELGVSQRVGIGTFSIYFGIGVVALWMIGDYRHAVDVAKASSGTVPADVATTAKTTDAVETENR